MNRLHFTQEQLTKGARLSDEDMVLLKSCRGAYNRLGLGYQLCHLKLFNRFPAYHPFIAIDELASFVAVQLDVPMEQLPRYTQQKATFFRHQDAICTHLRVEKFNQQSERLLKVHLLQQAQTDTG